MTEPTSPLKVNVRALGDSDDEGETVDSASQEESPSQPQDPQDLIQAHFDNISTASSFQEHATGCFCRQDRGETNVAREDPDANTKTGREEDGDVPKPAKSETTLVHSKGKEVARGRPTPHPSQCLPSLHALEAAKMIDLALNRPRSAIPYSGVPPSFVNHPRTFALDLLNCPRCTKAKAAKMTAAAWSDDAAVSPAPVPNPGVRPDFINPSARLPPLHNRPSLLAQYRRRIEFQKEKQAAAVVAGESSKSPRGSDEKPPEFETETASSTDSMLNIMDSENTSQQQPLLAVAGPHSGPSVHFDDNVQVHEAARSSESSSQQPLLVAAAGPHSGRPSVHFDESVQFHEGVRRARRRVKGRWTRFKIWAKREWRVKWK